MNENLSHLYSCLEFDRVLEEVAVRASSGPGKERVLAIEPYSSPRELLPRLDQVSDMMSILRYDDPFPIHGLYDIRKPLAQAELEGSILTVENLIKINKTLCVSQALYKYLGGRQSKYPALLTYFKDLRSFSKILRAVNAIIDPATGEIKDSASPELSHIRKTLRRDQERVRKRLNELVDRYKDYLQDSIITFREGRMVIPLREDCKGQVKGFIHDRSASGATLFIEPLEVLEMNNQIRELQIEEKREIERLLSGLTSLIREQIGEIRTSFQSLCELDTLFAIGRFGVEFNGSIPRYHPSKLELKRACHPLLLKRHTDREEVVPLNATMDDKTHLLIITGPNAGGKTVALKTIGLSALLFQCGLPIPADEQSQLSLFDQIFVDIGDSQSLEQDLSTFSAHVDRLSEILKKSTSKSLVLIDEIGTGTDPAEGSALAMAFLEKLHEQKTMTVVTTHHGALKEFAHKLPGAENASMAFDDHTLRPTYQFRIGIPGSSYAFEIARRLGIPDRLVKRARELAGTAHDKLEKFISELEQKLNRYQQLLAKTEIQKSELEGLTKLYREKYAALQKEEKKLKKKAVEESKAILDRANRVIEEAVKDIRTSKADKERVKEVRARIQSVKQEVEEQLEEYSEPQISPEHRPKLGDYALWPDMNVTGKVVSEPDAAGNVWLEAGDLKLQIALNSLRVVKNPKIKNKGAQLQTSFRSTQELRTEIDLRGMTMDEAEPVLEKYLDQAYLTGLKQVRIVHGKGTGVLRQKVNEYLKTHPKIEKTNFAAWNEGDLGVTVVTFKP